MSSYLVVKNTNSDSCSYLCKDTHTSVPYLKVDTGYLDLTTETTTGTYLVVKNSDSTYRPKRFITSTQDTTYDYYRYAQVTPFTAYINVTGKFTRTSAYFGNTSDYSSWLNNTARLSSETWSLMETTRGYTQNSYIYTAISTADSYKYAYRYTMSFSWKGKITATSKVEAQTQTGRSCFATSNNQFTQDSISFNNIGSIVCATSSFNNISASAWNRYSPYSSWTNSVSYIQRQNDKLSGENITVIGSTSTRVTIANTTMIDYYSYSNFYITQIFNVTKPAVCLYGNYYWGSTFTTDKSLQTSENILGYYYSGNTQIYSTSSNASTFVSTTYYTSTRESTYSTEV